MVDLTDGQRETTDTATKFAKDSNYKFNIYFDVYSDAANVYSISSIPDSYFIDKNGNIINSYVVISGMIPINPINLRLPLMSV